MQPRRKIITYKNRNRRKRDQDGPDPILTSPLSEMDEDETTLSEMNRRMGKRTRLLAAPSVPAGPSDTSKETGTSKRSRLEDTAPLTSGPLSTVFNAELHANSFQTPVTSALSPGKRVASGSLNYRPASSLSPVPRTKPAFHSNTKENFSALRPQTDLASPFNSHPNSRNASPTKSLTKFKPTKRPRAKSRTLSAHLTENRDFLVSAATDAAPSPDRKKAKTLHHGRNPSLPSFAVDDSPDWLNYAEVKPRKPIRGTGRRNVRGSSRSIFGVSGSGSQLFPIMHSSFSLELPLAFSTPPTNRHLDLSPQSSVDWNGTNLIPKFLDTDVEDEDVDVEMTDAEPFTPDSASRAPRLTKNRRQTHIAHDSLFSSMDITGSGSGSTITSIPPRTSNEQNMGGGLSDDTGLTSAMSLTRTLEPTDPIKLPDLGQGSVAPPDDVGRFGVTDDQNVSNAPAQDQPRGTRKKSSAACLDDLEVLGDKISEMNLEGFARFVSICSMLK